MIGGAQDRLSFALGIALFAVRVWQSVNVGLHPFEAELAHGDFPPRRFVANSPPLIYCYEYT